MTLKNDSLLSAGKYRIVRFISAGGFGCTYEAVHTLMNTCVAIKEFFPKDFCNRDENTSQVSVGTKSQEELVARLKKQFLREAKVLFDMRHPSVVRVIDFFEDNGTAYYAMDYIDGPSLEQILKENGPMPEPEAMKYVAQICDALGYVHSEGQLHLDLKPNNVMINSSDGRAVLIDFGTSKQYSTDGGATSTMFGMTPGYAPPEQCSSNIKDLGAASDIYALGATLYRMLTGNTPVDALSRSAGTQMLPLPSTVSTPVAMAIDRAMTLNRNLRPQSAEEFMKIINTPVPHPPTPVFTPDSPAIHSNDTRAMMQPPHQPPRHPDDTIPHYRKPKSNSLKYLLIGAGVFILLCIVAGVAASGDDSGNGASPQEQTEVIENASTSSTSPESLQPTSTENQDATSSTASNAAEGLRVYSYDIHQEYITLRYETETPGTVELSFHAYNKDNGKSMDETFTLDSNGGGDAIDLQLPYPLTQIYDYHITLTDRRTGQKLIDDDWHY